MLLAFYSLDPYAFKVSLLYFVAYKVGLQFLSQLSDMLLTSMIMDVKRRCEHFSCVLLKSYSKNLNFCGLPQNSNFFSEREKSNFAAQRGVILDFKIIYSTTVIEMEGFVTNNVACGSCR